MSIENVVNQFMQAIQKRDADEILPLLTDDVIFEDVPEGSAIHGKDAAYERFKNFFNMVSKIESKIEREVYSGDVAVVERKNHLCFQGKDVVLPVISVIEMKDDKIALFREYFDSETFAKQVA